MERKEQIENRLREIRLEEKKLLAEVASLDALKESEPLFSEALGSPVQTAAPKTPDEKIRLFAQLFVCRESVYPRLWENFKTGKKGYSPVCSNEWKLGLCEKPKVKCGECRYQAFPRLDSSAIRRHLEGSETLGTYAIREDDRCVFLASDFDGDGWREDASVFRLAARELGISAEIERSRSGNGAHAWIFFTEPIQARIARQLGTAIVARALAMRHTMSLKSYDRFFPNQDTIPKGGFGNLIALPLQKRPREQGNSVFLDDSLDPIPDQWGHLSVVKRLSPEEVQKILGQTLKTEFSLELVKFEDAEIASAEKLLDSGRRKVQPGCFPGQIDFQIGAQLQVTLAGLPSNLISAFKRTATFANPTFFEKQRMRFSTWNIPRFIFCGELLPDQLILPRGVLDQCLEISKIAGSQVVIRDSRPRHKKLKASFYGELSSEQSKAVKALLSHDTGVLVAPPGAGKTVMACAAVAKRKVSTLVLVHRAPLLEQWRSQFARFLGVKEKEVGVLAGQRKKLTGKLDVGMLQTVTKLEDVEEVLSQYGQIIIDECHHIPAVSFEAVLKKCAAQYVMGLTATPYRKDGHQSIIHMQCGPIRYEMKSVDGIPLKKTVIVRETSFRMPVESGPQPAIHEVWSRLILDVARLNLIAQDIIESVQERRVALVISDRKQHLEEIEKAVKATEGGSQLTPFVLIGGMGKKARAKVLAEIATALAEGQGLYLLATGSLIGEGIDIPALDTLVLAMPISFRGRMIQYAVRLHRPNAGKTEVRIYDYLDSNSGLTVSMFRKRLAAYKKMEYRVELPLGLSIGATPFAHRGTLVIPELS